ncbi:DNA polymerase III, subunit gamma and tau [Candidatus Falkowbacteria bacterium RIFOXYA2_FULL_35_8]|uniref:DNA polymerase III subunit gamma/tau n=1 Tax=Candidatus Falkowbacteria bacterium RIFOXYC2_FULL_36_12 TaxID=1798002 RepID=A0A1F5SWP3_9BACT|nr:MAG: DNA polymerase III, subunit gamma and tau [Candidatus Falkowbacteria bacterium RIFOXYC2_FULL_36_12]OGF34252.1 MAG: DNA polymerase III, subunit gamma and tau [Candidatus Falkowbacteria bacterium RIFOXYA2_FULL_35_8]
MSVALYRKYRPKSFSEVTSQNHIKITLQNELESNRLAHAYLFCGPRGTGKTTLARLISKSANCLDLQPHGEPCNKCKSCLDIMDNKAMDIIEIDAASHTGVENVRENIINNVRFTPTSSKYKIFIIDEVHMLSISSFNALLKVLEEPPKYVIFILATTEIHKVPLTIISRCQRFDFKKIIIPELINRLKWIVSQEGMQVEEKILELVAKNAGGCVRDAESLLEQVLSLDEKSITLEQAELIIPRSNYDTLISLLKNLIDKDTASAINLVNKLVDDGVDIKTFFDNFIEFVRRVMVYKVVRDTADLLHEVDEKMLDQILKLIEGIEASELVNYIEEFLKAKELFKQSYILQLPLEVAIINLTSEPRVRQVVTPTKPLNVVKLKVEPAPAVVDDINENEDQSIENEAEQAENNEQKTENQELSVEVESGVVDAQLEDNVSNEPMPKAGNGLTVTFQQVISRWPYIIKSLTVKNYSLAMSLSVAKPLKLEGNKLIVGFMFELQRSRVDIPNNLVEIVDTLQTEFGINFELMLVVDDKIKLDDITNGRGSGNNIPPPEVERIVSDDPVDQVLNAFGGSVVE